MFFSWVISHKIAILLALMLLSIGGVIYEMQQEKAAGQSLYECDRAQRHAQASGQPVPACRRLG